MTLVYNHGSTGAASLLLLALTGAATLFAGCSHKGTRQGATQELPAIAVRTQIVESKPSAAIEEVVGTIRARLRATIEAKTTGRIIDMPIDLGRKIEAGELLVRLDAPEIKARLEQAEASLQQAEKEWNRVSSLFNQQAATRADADAAQSHYLVAKGAASEAHALMGYVEIRAPFDGVVTRKWVDVGDQAAPGKPLVDVEDSSRLQLEADVPEAIADKIQQDARMTIRVGQGEGELSGTVAEIAPIAEPASRTFRVKLDLPSLPDQSAAALPDAMLHAPRFLRSGQFARLLVPVGETSSLRIPSSAVLQRGQMELVFVVENQRAQLHLVKTGRRVKEDAEILSGLDAGDSVVVEGAAQLVDGQKVEAK